MLALQVLLLLLLLLLRPLMYQLALQVLLLLLMLLLRLQSILPLGVQVVYLIELLLPLQALVRLQNTPWWRRSRNGGVIGRRASRKQPRNTALAATILGRKVAEVSPDGAVPGVLARRLADHSGIGGRKATHASLRQKRP